ncbi:hypothetical protein HHK36_020141 [Tetracentron sinense]|uniref:Amino acid transporter transmembrane domain-containing protein n=1 Tax=Tetracentron sinense TaxID=13715 RepID=A0A834YR36_TETSI|nr:hypothetical protein HHK36_020141 [Tetracentron sinense]
MTGAEGESVERMSNPESDSLPHPNQVERESVHGSQLPTEGNRNHSDFDGELKSGVNVKDRGENQMKSKSSFVHAVLNMIGMLIGLGQLSTPYALENGGWASAFLLVGLGIICAYTSHLLGSCLERNPNSRNYQDIGNHAFGMKGRVITSIFIYMEIFLALVSYTISLSDNLTRVFAGAHLHVPRIHLSTSELLTVMAILVALPSLWLRDLSSISFLSTAGILMSILIFVTVICTAAFGVKANHKIPALQLHNIPLVSGLYMYSLSGHTVFPNIYKAMQDPSKFTKVSIASFTLVTIHYSTLAFVGAKLYGPEVNSQITLSMPRHLVVTKIALWATVITPMTKYALELAPIAIQIENNLPYSMNSRMRMLIRGSIGSLLLLVILVLALSVPYFQYILGLTGSLVSISVCIILPCTFHTKIYWSQISKPILILNGTLIVFGSLLSVLGVISSSKSLIKSIERGHSH